MAGIEEEIEREIKKVESMLESSEQTLIFSFAAFFFAVVLILFVKLSSPFMYLLFLLPLFIFLIFLFFMAEEWASHRRKLRELKSKRNSV
ncbi:hypothetical protein DRN74_04110 [Candidatus Micrarchaeota archaeon]|nr:MAG: hypothetical protein DRN74_04110 [Candidatus Micrarchaeota archaeon]